ncbi:hypothetical protein D3C85_1576050 [compost metagenome]
MVGLETAHGNDRVDPGLQRSSEMELELAQLVATPTHQHVIVALEKQADALRLQPQQLFQALGPLNRGGPLQQICSRKRTQ